MATAVQGECSAESFKWPTRDAMEENLRAARRVVTTARHTAEDLAADTVSKVRSHPLRSVGAAMMAGAFVGSAVGLFAGWFMRPRRRRWGW